jgi:hypothetical protein
MKKFAFTILSTLMLAVAVLNVSAQSSSAQTRDVSGFTSIASSGSFNVHVTINGTESLKIDADADVINNIVTEVKDGTLKIRFKDYVNYNHRDIKKLDIYVTAKTLAGLANSGSGSIEVGGVITTDNFKLALSGSGTISSSIKSEGLKAVISGSGSVNLSGEATDASIVIAGSGELKGKELQTASASVTITGSGNVYLKADKSISATIIGSGNVIYSGDAVASTKRIGSGRVTKSDD